MSRIFEYDVFLSHSSKDRQIVQALAERLKADGLKVTWDEEKIEQARTLVMCMSPAYFDSEWGTLVHDTQIFRDPTNAQRRFIPLLIAQFAYIDWRTPSAEAYDELLAVCRGEEPEKEKPPEPEEKADQARMVLKGHTDRVHGVAVTPDGKTVVSGSSDNTLKVWDLETGHCRATFEGHTDTIYTIAVTPDGKTIVSCSDDKTLKVWDMAAGHCRGTFEGHTGFINDVAVTPDGKTVVSGSAVGALKVWDLATAAPPLKDMPILSGM